jgi:hypothetical protein
LASVAVYPSPSSGLIAPAPVLKKIERQPMESQPAKPDVATSYLFRLIDLG